MTNPCLTGFSDENTNSLSNDSLKFNRDFSADSIENFNQFPAFGNEYRLVKKQELKQIEVNGHSFDIIDTVIFHSEYKLNPYYDLNGVGLLYFASYPTINDCCEANYFNSKRDNNDRWEQTYVTTARDILYYANCDVNDSIIYKLNTHEEVSHTKVKLSSSLYRKSDNKLMARIFTIKNRIL
jgi:probable biosynthetic protein (TIGR04098 family)